MIPQKYRLLLRDVRDFFLRAKKTTYPAFFVYITSSALPHPQIAVTIKPQHTHAVERNRVKRVFRAMLVSHFPTLYPACYFFVLRTLDEKHIKMDFQRWIKENTKK